MFEDTSIFKQSANISSHKLSVKRVIISHLNDKAETLFRMFLLSSFYLRKGEAKKNDHMHSENC